MIFCSLDIYSSKNDRRKFERQFFVPFLVLQNVKKYRWSAFSSKHLFIKTPIHWTYIGVPFHRTCIRCALSPNEVTTSSFIFYEKAPGEWCYNECIRWMGALHADSVKRHFDEKAFRWKGTSMKRHSTKISVGILLKAFSKMSQWSIKRYKGLISCLCYKTSASMVGQNKLECLFLTSFFKLVSCLHHEVLH